MPENYDWLTRGLEPEVRPEYLAQKRRNEELAAQAAAAYQAQARDIQSHNAQLEAAGELGSTDLEANLRDLAQMIMREAPQTLSPEEQQIITTLPPEQWEDSLRETIGNYQEGGTSEELAYPPQASGGAQSAGDRQLWDRIESAKYGSPLNAHGLQPDYLTDEEVFYAQSGGIAPRFGGTNMNGISMSTQPARRRIRPENMRTGIGMGRPRNTFPFQSQKNSGITMAQTAPAYSPAPGPTDTVPAMLTPGEGILNTGAMTMPGMRGAVNQANQIGLMRNAYAQGTNNVPEQGISPEAGQAIAAIIAGFTRGSGAGYAAGSSGVEPIGYTDPIEEAEWMKIVQMVPPNTDIAKLKAQAQSSGISAETIAKLVGSLGSQFGAGGAFSSYAAPQYSMGDLAGGGGAATGGFVTESGIVPGYAGGTPGVHPTDTPNYEDMLRWMERLAGGGAQSAGLRQLMDKYFGPPNSIGLQPDFVSDEEPVYASEGGIIEGFQAGGTAGRGGGRTTYYGPNMFGRYPGGSMPSLQDLNEIVGNRNNLLGEGARAYHPSEPGRGEDVHGVGRDVVDVYRPGPAGWGGFGNLPSRQLRESGLGGPISGNTLSQTGWSNRNTGNPGVYAPIPTWANRANAIYGAGPRGTFGRGTAVGAGTMFSGYAGSGVGTPLMGGSLSQGAYWKPWTDKGNLPNVPGQGVASGGIVTPEGVVQSFAGGGVAGRPASWGTGKPTRDLIGMGIGGLSNLLLPGLGFATSPLARYVTSLVQRGKWGSFAPNIPNAKPQGGAPAGAAPPPVAAPQAGYGEGSGGGQRGFEGLGGGGFEPLSGAGVGVPGYGGSLGPSSGYMGGQLGYSTSQGWNWKPWKDVGNLPTNPSQGV